MNSLIETLNQWGGDFLSFAWPMLWQSSLLMAVLLAFDFLCRRRIRASIRYALWLVVLVKLCLPPALALPTGVAWWLFPSKAAGQTSPVTKYVITYDTTTPTDSIQLNVPMLAPPPPKLDDKGWALVGSGFVSVVLLLWLAVRWWQILRKVGCATASVNLTRLLDQIRGQADLRSSLRLKLVGGQMSPAVCGLFRPVILLPRVLAEQLSAEQLRAVLLHEAFHLRRKDVWVNCAQALLQIVYWWHPLLWLANARIRRLREEAVDDAVMLALSGEAESYAPTLLAVAKLALSRPLMSLGLVGIMESRSALRKRIERLVNFHAPRKAGLTALSLCGIFVFSAVALPMGPAPASAPDSFPGDAASAETTLTVKVDPDTFIRNVKAHADWTIPTGTNDYTEILLDTLRSEGVNCNPPHGIAFNTRTGEMTMQNTPEQLEIFRRVLEQLNRADGKAELPLRDSPFQRKSILIEARFFWMPPANFENLTRDLHAYNGGHGNAPWWSVPPDSFGEFNDRIKSLNLKPFVSPRVQTGHGITAEFYVGTNTNGTEFDCRPLVIPGGIELAFRTQITGAPTGGDQTLVGTNRYQIHGTAAAEDYGGIVLRAENPNGATTNLVLVLGLHTVTNVPPAHFQERLQAIIAPRNGAFTNNAPPHFAQRLQAIIVRSTNAANTPDSSGSTQGTTGNPAGFVERARVTIPENASSARDLVRDGKWLYEMGKLDDAEAKLRNAIALNPNDQTAIYYLNLTTKARDVSQSRSAKIIYPDWDTSPVKNHLYHAEVIKGRRNIVTELNRVIPANVFYDQVPLGLVVSGLQNELGKSDGDGKTIELLVDQTQSTPVEVTIRPELVNPRLADVLDAIMKGADRPIQYSIVDYGVVFSLKGQELPPVFTRTFKIDPNTLLAGLRQQTQLTGTDAQDVVTAVKKLISDAGVDLLPTNKAVFYNDRRGLIIVRATANDLDTIERLIPALNLTPPQIHIKARFVEVSKQGFVFSLPGTKGSAGQATGILSDPHMRTVMKLLEAKPGFEVLAQPEVVTTSGRQTQMRATSIINVVTNFAFEETATNTAISPQMEKVECGPVLDVVPYVLSDGYTISLTLIPSLTEFLGYEKSTNTTVAYDRAGEKIDVPIVLPRLRVRQVVTTLNLWDNQTVILSGLPETSFVSGTGTADNSKSSDKELLVFITATIVDSAGNRVHTDDERPFAKAGPPPQAY